MTTVLFTKEEVEYVLATLKTLNFNIADARGIVTRLPQQEDFQIQIIKDTLQMDMDYLVKLDSFIKKKFNRGE